MEGAEGTHFSLLFFCYFFIFFRGGRSGGVLVGGVLLSLSLLR